MSDRKAVSSGIIAAAVTPRRPQEETIDLAATLELIDFLCEGGIDGILALGSTGEFVHFGLDDRIRMVAMAVKRSRLPLLANVSHSTLDGAIRLGQEAADAGVAAVLLLPPFYFPYGQDLICEFFLRFADQVAKNVPVYLYNIPRCTNELAVETAVRLLSTGMFAGIKDSCGQWPYLETVLRERQAKPWQIFTGDESLFLQARDAGGEGTISGAASAVPELLAALNRAYVAGGRTQAERLNGHLLEFLSRIDHLPRPVATKEAARLRGIDTGAHSIPLGEKGGRALDGFLGWFEDWLPGVLKECRE